MEAVLGQSGITVSWTWGAGVSADIVDHKLEWEWHDGTQPQRGSESGIAARERSRLVRGLACGTTYTFKVSGRGDGDPYRTTYGNTKEAYASTPVCGLSKPTGLTITPLSQRRALLTWEAVDGADEYTVQVLWPGTSRSPSTGTLTPTWGPPIRNPVVNGHEAIVTEHQNNGVPQGNFYYIDLEYISGLVIRASDGSLPSDGEKTYVLLTYDGSLKDYSSFQFRVQAVDSDDTSRNSVFSDPVIVIDTPILSANGKSSHGGRVTLSWTPVHDTTILGPNYSGGTYSFRYRAFGTYQDVGHVYNHTDFGWQPENFATDEIDSKNRNGQSITGTSHEISPGFGLTLNQVYAIQLIYNLEIRGVPVRVFSGRDVYAWPSTRGATDGERVATFPLMPTLRDKTHSYLFCEETFPESSRSDWSDVVRYAFGQWELATNNVITVERIEEDENGESLDCADYSMFVDQILTSVKNRIENSEQRPSDSSLRVFVTTLLDTFDQAGIESTRNKDRMLNEVYMINDVDNILLEIGESPGVFPEVSNRVGSGYCFGQNAVACYSPQVDYLSDGSQVVVSGDIMILRSKVSDGSLGIPGIDNVPSRDDTPLNICPPPDPFLAHRVVLHEAGHALGIIPKRDRNPPPNFLYTQVLFHPSIGQIAMSLGTLSDICSPTPFDVLAIYALYQVR